MSRGSRISSEIALYGTAEVYPKTYAKQCKDNIEHDYISHEISCVTACFSASVTYENLRRLGRIEYQVTRRLVT